MTSYPPYSAQCVMLKGFFLFQTSFSGHNYAFACDGRTFGLIRTHDATLLNSIVQKGKIFARMLPEQKIHLIECLKDLG